jgi:hypothetical protein
MSISTKGDRLIRTGGIIIGEITITGGKPFALLYDQPLSPGELRAIALLIEAYEDVTRPTVIDPRVG